MFRNAIQIVKPHVKQVAQMTGYSIASAAAGLTINALGVEIAGVLTTRYQSFFTKAPSSEDQNFISPSNELPIHPN